MITKRQRALLAILKSTGTISRLRLVKTAFLLMEKAPPEGVKPYRFVPYQYGPFSFELYNDLRLMERNQLVHTVDETNVELSPSGVSTGSITLGLDAFEVLDKTQTMTDRELIEDIYDRYPEYTIFSRIERKMDYVRDRTGVLTVGYEGRDLDEFMNVLIEEKIQTLADVRNRAFSMKYGFSKKHLVNACEKVGITYWHVPELGVPKSYRSNLQTREDYDRLFEKYDIWLESMTPALDKLKSMSASQRLALMCYERDPSYCHRGRIAHWLENKCVGVCHR
jgi:uncharacterized protein (DUF488 family)